MPPPVSVPPETRMLPEPIEDIACIADWIVAAVVGTEIGADVTPP